MGAELLRALPDEFRALSPSTYRELTRVSRVTRSSDGTITVWTKDEKPLAFGEAGKGYIVVESGASFMITESGGKMMMTRVKKIKLSETPNPGMTNSTALKAATIDGQTGNAILDGSLKDAELNFGETILGQ
jgi:hypothetical protein